MQEKTVSTTEIIRATGKSRAGILKRANKEQWETISDTKGKKKFILERLPEDIKEALLNYKDQGPQKTPEFKATENGPEQDDATTESMSEEIRQKPSEEQPSSPGPSIPQEVPMRIPLSEQKEKEVKELLARAEKKSILLLGKNGSGKTYTLELLAEELSKKYKVVHFKETPTAKTILLNISIACEIKPGDSKEDTYRSLEQYRGEKIVLCIDQLENITPSSVAVIDKLISDYTWFRFIGAGHLGGKKKHNATWMKAQAHFLRSISRHDSMKLIDQIWPGGDMTHKKIIVDESRGIPGNIVKMAKEARQGIMPQEEQRYLDATPIILIIATVGLAIRVIGYGYQSTETYIMGGVIGTVFWGLFWIYRGYIQGWWGSRKPKFSKKQG